jgi:hypothetical protein
MIKSILSSALLLLLLLNVHAQPDTLEEPKKVNTVQILMKDVSGGDFDFQNDWSYPQNVFKSQWGELVCNWICPPELDEMRAEDGKILEDSLTAYYRLLDTTHLPHTIKCEADMYEFTGTNFIEFRETKNGVVGRTGISASTHSTLNIQIEGVVCTAWVDYNSVRNIGRQRFELQQGRVLLDKTSFSEGILKGSFDFRFVNHLDPKVSLSWRGTILSPVLEE